MGYFRDFESVDTVDVVRIAGADGKPACDRGRYDHRVVGPRCCLVAAAPQRCCHAAERSRRDSIEKNRIEVCFGSLKMNLA